MTPSIAAINAPKSSQAHKPARPVIPVIPLHYMKKKSKTPPPTAPAATTPQEILSHEASAEGVPEPVTLTPASSPPLITSDITATLLSQSSGVKNEVTATLHIHKSHEAARKSDDSEGTLVEVTEGVEPGRDHLKLAVESDKSSTLANDSRPTTTEPSSSSFTMPPPFYPILQENLQQHDDSSSFCSTDAPRQSPMHHAHPDLRNLQIGTSIYSESRGSSPLHSNLGLQYPPADPMFNINGHSQRHPNGFSPLDLHPPPGFFQQQEPHIAYRQVASFTSPDAYSPSATPLEQQRFPSYPSSTHNGFEGNGQPIYSRFATPISPNAANGHPEDMHVIQQPQSEPNGPQSSSQALASGNLASHHRPMPPQFPMHDHLDGLLEYLTDQFDNATYADYLLELHYSDSRAHPFRISGHNLLFARSPALNNLMATTTGQLTVDGSKRLLRLETDDRFVTSEGFYMAVSRLYGGHLLDEGGPSIDRSPRTAGSLVERLNLALGYAAAGHLLHISPVVDRGIMVASRLVNWSTVEKALDFAIDGGLDSHWTLEPDHHGFSRSTYGRMANHLIQSALDFALGSFPTTFDLDTSAPDFTYNNRLPAIKVPDVQTVYPSTNHPLITNPRLSSIKFGDVTFSSENTPETTPNFVLSKLLFSLPFHLLKYMLEHPRLGNLEGWAATQLCQNVIYAAVEEREKRRLRVYSSSIPNSKRADNQRQWEAVGWKESVNGTSPPGSSDHPTLTRTWVGFTLLDN